MPELERDRSDTNTGRDGPLRAAYLDTSSGISGDMVLGAFVDAGIPLSTVERELRKLPFKGFEISERRVLRNSVSATRVEIMVNPKNAEVIGSDGDGVPECIDARGKGSAAQHGSKAHRKVLDIIGLIKSAGFSRMTEDRAVSVFRAIGNAEARIHGTSFEEAHLHEIGSIDSILDIVGIAICLDVAAVDLVFSGPAPIGTGGRIHTSHGVIPLPAPATLELLKGYPVRFTDVTQEIVTPTGAAVLAALSSGLPPADRLLLPETIGYGAGSRQIDGLPNFLRVVLGEIRGDSGTIHMPQTEETDNALA